MVVMMMGSVIAVNAQPVRIVFGSPTQVVLENGTVWEAKPCPSGSTAYVVQNKPDIVGAQYGNLCYSTSLVSIEFLVNPGVYSVRLHFIEQNANVGPGGRLFTVKINGDLYKNPFDIFKSCGYLQPCQIAYPIVDVGGKIKIELMWTKYNAVISAIEILPVLTDNSVFGCAIPEACKDIIDSVP